MKNINVISTIKFYSKLISFSFLFFMASTVVAQTWENCNEMVISVDDFNTTLDFENQPADCGCSSQGECTLVRIRLVETINGVETPVSTTGIGFMPPLGNDSEPNQISKDYIDLFDPYFSQINCTEYQAPGSLPHNYLISPVAPPGQEFHVLVCPGSEAGVRNGRFFLPPGDPSPTIAAPTNVNATDGAVQTDVSFGTIPGKYYMAFRNSENCNDAWVKIDGNSNWPQATTTTMTIRDQQGSTYGNEYEYRVIASDFAFNPATTAAGIWSDGDLGHGGALLQAYDADNSCSSSGSDCANDTEAPTCSDLDVTIVGDVSDGFATVDFNLLFTDNCDIDLEIYGANSTTGLEITETDIVPCGETIEYIMLATDDNLNQETCTFNVTADCGDNPTDPDTCLVEASFSNLLWSSYLGGDGEDEIVDVFVDEQTDIQYVLGKTTSTNFYSTNPEIGTSAQGLKTFVMAINPDASLNWSTILNGWDDPQAIDMDPDGYLTLVGITDNTMLPGALGLPGYDKTHNGGKDILILKLEDDGSNLIYSSYYGGTGSDRAFEFPNFNPDNLKVDFSEHKVYLMGATRSLDLPVTMNAIDNNPGQAFVAVLDITMNTSTLEFASYLKDDINGEIAALPDGGMVLLTPNGNGEYANYISPNAIEDEYDGFAPLPILLKFDNNFNSVYGTYIGVFRTHDDTMICDVQVSNGTPASPNYFYYDIKVDDCGDIYWFSRSNGFRAPFFSSEFLLPANKYLPELTSFSDPCLINAGNPLLKINFSDLQDPYIEYMLFFGYGGMNTAYTNFDIDNSRRLHFTSRGETFFDEPYINFSNPLDEIKDNYIVFENDLSSTQIHILGSSGLMDEALKLKVFDNEAYVFGVMNDALVSVSPMWMDEDGNSNTIIQSTYGTGNTDGFISVIDNNELCDGCGQSTNPCMNTVLHFDGVDDRIIADSPLMGNSDYSISLDFKGGPQNNGSYPRLISFTSFETEIAISGTELAYYNGSTWTESNVDVADNSWHNAVLVRSNGQHLLYLDGILLSANPGPATLNFTGSMAIGGKTSSANENFEGLIDNVKVWDTPLDSMEICEVANLNPKALHYDFEIGNGGEDNTGIMEIPDLIGSNNGMLNNFSLTGDVSNLLCEEYEISECPDVCDLDTNPPLVSCPVNSSIININSDGTFSPSISSFNVTADDDCKMTFSFSPEVFTCDDLGDNLVVLTVTDEAGNTSGCNINFVLNDPSNYCGNNSCDNNTVIHFDGINDKVVTTSPLVGNADYTISLNFKCLAQTNGTYARLLGFTSFETEIAIKGTELAYYNGSSWRDSGINVADDFCHNVTLVRVNNENALYLDGILISVLAAPANLTFGGNLNIGGKDSGSNEFYEGTIDNVKIWNTALDSSQLCELNTLDSNALYYDFEEGNGDNDNSGIVGPLDLSSSGNNGTFTGFALNGISSNYICEEVCNALKPCVEIPQQCDEMCMTDEVDLSTGVNFNDGTLLSIGQYDGGWAMVSGPDMSLNYPQPGFVLNPNGSWSGQLNAQYISPFANTSNNNSFPEPYTFERQFCICEWTTIDLDIATLFDNFIEVGLYDESGVLIEQLINVQTNSTDNFTVPTTSNTTHLLSPGIYSLRAGLRNDAQESMGMAIEATLTGAGLISSGCCSPYQYITGTVFEDTACDAVYSTNSDPVFADIIVSLCDQSGMVLQQSTTDVFGFYTFFDVDPGEYIIKQDAISGLVLTLGNGGYQINIQPNTVTSNIDFGNCSDPCINDQEAPVLNCSSELLEIELSPDGTANITQVMFDIIATDNCGQVTITGGNTTASCANIGQNIYMTITATDEVGLSTTCQVGFLITDPDNYCEDNPPIECDPYLECDLADMVIDSCSYVVPDFTSNVEVLDTCCFSSWAQPPSSGYGSHAVVIKSDQSLWGWGQNTNGQLGLGDQQVRKTPVVISKDQWKDVSSGNGFTMVIKADGTLWGTGSNTEGQLGLPSTIKSTNTLTQIGKDSDWQSISSSFIRSYGIKTDGSLWRWGKHNGAGELYGPEQFGNDSDWKNVNRDFVGFKQDGKLFSWGINNDLPEEKLIGTSWVDAASSGVDTYLVKSDGTIWHWDNVNVPTQIGTRTNWVSLDIVLRVLVVLNEDQELWSLGRGINGGLGNGALVNSDVLVQTLVPSNIESYSVYTEGCFVYLDDQSIWAFGANENNSVLAQGNTSQTKFANPVEVLNSTEAENVSGAFNIIQDPLPGDLITEDTKVTLTAYDQNNDILDSCCLNILLCDLGSCQNDVVNPICNTQNVVLSLDQNGIASITPQMIDNGSSDECGEVTLELSNDAFSCADIGDNEVTLFVTDQAGNQSSCSAIVTIEDKTNPICIIQNIVVSLDQNGIASITPQMIDNGSSDECGEVTLELSNDTFSCADIGDNEVTLFVTDLAGNQNSCSAIVTIEDKTNPICIIQNIVVSLDQNGIASITPQMIDNGSSDECGEVTLELSNDAFSCADIGDNEVTLFVTDQAGNQSSCSAIVTIEDKTNPICIIQDIEIELDSNGQGSITVDDINNVSTDNCDISLEISRSNFNCNDVGIQTVILTVSDSSGNSVECEATVNVIENEEACNDPTCLFNCTEECSTGTINLSTGITSVDESFLSIGAFDANWTLISSPDPGIQVPRPSFVLDPNPVWSNLPGSQYISAYPNAGNNASNIEDGTFYEFEKCFCVCEDVSNISIDLAAYVDNNLEILLFSADGTEIQSLLDITDTTAGAFTGDPEVTETDIALNSGIYCLRARLKNDATVTMGMSIEAFITGGGLLENQCCKTYNAITGIVFEDKECNGNNEIVSDVGLSNWTVQLCSADTITQAIDTDVFGYYSFNNVVPGDYTVKALNLDGINSSTEVISNITIGINEVVSYDFGFCDIGSLVKDNLLNQQIVVYPNPFNKSISIQLETEHQLLNCKIINTLGEEITKFKIKENVLEKDIDLNTSNGVYYILFYDGNNELKTSKKIIKI